MKRVKKEVTGNNQQKRDESYAKHSSVSIPVDLIVEILAKLPPKLLAKLVCVSKLWSSIIHGKDFADFFLTRSLTRPRFLFTFHREDHHEDHRVFLSVSQDAPSSGHHHSTSIKTPDREYVVTPPIRGLICCQIDSKVVISNPSTGQFVSLPRVKTRRRLVSSFFGYDHVRDEYKVLSMTVLQVGYTRGPVVSGEHQVLTLGKAQKTTKTKASWRMIECNVPHCPAGTKGVCLDGVVYYGAWSNSRRRGSMIVRFDVRLEEFSLVDLPDHVEIKSYHQYEVVSYERKMALLIQLYDGKVEVLVLEDVEKQEWSTVSVVVTSWGDLVGEDTFVTCRGVLSSGEFIFTPPYGTAPFFLISYDPKENNATRVEIGRFGDRVGFMTVFLDYAECPVYFCKGRLSVGDGN